MFDDDNIALWVGTNPGEIIRVGDLQRRIAKYAVIPEVVRLRLEPAEAPDGLVEETKVEGVAAEAAVPLDARRGVRDGR